jgi:predicted small integral membrane protein
MTIDQTALTTLAFYATIMVVVIMLGTTIVGSIAFWRAQKGQAKTFSLLLQRANALKCWP